MANEISLPALIEKLTDQTNNDKCHWKMTSEKDSYQLELYSNKLTLSQGNTMYGITYYFRVADYMDETIEDSAFYSSQQSDEYFMLETLYKAIESYMERKKTRAFGKIFTELDKM